MSELIEQKRQEGRDQKVERYDLFSSLMNASEDEENGAGLTDVELMGLSWSFFDCLLLTNLPGNIFIFLLAGHETAAHTLCYSFGLLALYPDEQEKLYKHCTSVPVDGEVPVRSFLSMYSGSKSLNQTYQQMGLFTQALACVHLSVSARN